MLLRIRWVLEKLVSTRCLRDLGILKSDPELTFSVEIISNTHVWATMMGGEHSNITLLGQRAVWAQSTIRRHSSSCSMHSNACLLFCLQAQPRSRECRDINLEERLAPTWTVSVTASMQSYIWNRTHTSAKLQIATLKTLSASKTTPVLLSLVSFLKTQACWQKQVSLPIPPVCPRWLLTGTLRTGCSTQALLWPVPPAALPALPTWHN